MNLVVCVIFERDLQSLLLVEQNIGRGHWFPFDEIKSGETRALAAKRVADKVSSYDFEPISVFKIRCTDVLPCLPSMQTYFLLNKGQTTRLQGTFSGNAVWMNLERMKAAIKNRELLGLEPFYVLKNILERIQQNGWEDIVNTKQIFEEPTVLYINYNPTDVNNQSPGSSYEQLINAAKFTIEVQERIFKEYYSFTFPSEYMSYRNFMEAMDNKLTSSEKRRFQDYFRAFDVQQKSYLTYTDYLLGLAAMDPNTSHGGTPAEQRCRYIYRFYAYKCTGSMSIEEFHDMHTAIQGLKGGLVNGEQLTQNDIVTAFNLFNLNSNNQLLLNDFLNSVGQLKYRGTSVLFRLQNNTQDLLRMSRRFKDTKSDNQNSMNVEYGIADHCVTLKRTGILSQVESLRTMSYNKQFSVTTGKTFKQLPRSSSEEIFDQKTIATEIQEMLRYFEKQDETKQSLTWTPNSYIRLGEAVIKLCKEVREIFKNEARCLRLTSPCYILGDIHGNYQDLICFEKCLWRATPLLSPALFLFLGDYVDRGIHGLEVIIYLLAAKYQCPQKVYLLRGNHEIRKIQQMFTFFQECIGKFGDVLGREVWDAINSVFDVLPLAAVIDDKILCLHGGIPSPVSCPGDFISSVNDIPIVLSEPELESPLAWEMMWNDPCSFETNLIPQIPIGADQGFFNNLKRSTGNYFTNDALMTFLSKNNFTHVVRAHEVQQVGFKVQLSGRLLTVFSSSNYCGGTNEAAAVLVDSSKLRLIRLDIT